MHVWYSNKFNLINANFSKNWYFCLSIAYPLDLPIRLKDGNFDARKIIEILLNWTFVGDRTNLFIFHFVFLLIENSKLPILKFKFTAINQNYYWIYTPPWDVVKLEVFYSKINKKCLETKDN